jgi:hypothetical protein
VLDLKSLNQDFTCPICLGILKETMTTMDCMHRFCSECIITCLRMSNKECPTCRVRESCCGKGLMCGSDIVWCMCAMHKLCCVLFVEKHEKWNCVKYLLTRSRQNVVPNETCDVTPHLTNFCMQFILMLKMWNAKSKSLFQRLIGNCCCLLESMYFFILFLLARLIVSPCEERWKKG